MKRGPFSLIKILQLMQKKLLLSENFTRIYYFPRPFFLSLKKWKLFNDFSSHLQLSQCVDSEKNRFSNKSVWIFSWLVKLKKRTFTWFKFEISHSTSIFQFWEKKNGDFPSLSKEIFFVECEISVVTKCRFWDAI